MAAILSRYQCVNSQGCAIYFSPRNVKPWGLIVCGVLFHMNKNTVIYFYGWMLFYSWLLGHFYFTNLGELNQYWAKDRISNYIHIKIWDIIIHTILISALTWMIEAEWRIYASSNWVIIGSDNGLLPVRRQAIIWTNAGILLNGPSGTNFSEIFIGIQTFSFKKFHLKMSSAKWRLFCLGLDELNKSL